MIKLKNLFTRVLLALLFASAAGAALAGPMYRVSVDTSSLAGTGLLDFTFIGTETSAPATATLTNFYGNFAAGSWIEGDASGDVFEGVVLGNSKDFNAFTQEVNLGGRFGFDVRFSDLGPAGDGTTLGVALYSPGFGAYLLTEGNLATFELLPETPVGVSVDETVVRSAEVPEPANLALMTAGLALMAFTVRRRRQK